MENVRVGLLGHGTVGSAFAQLLNERRDSILGATGIDLVISAVAVRNLDNHDLSHLEEGVLKTTEPLEVVESAAVDLVVELMGGMEPAKSVLVAALGAGKPVVTGNKELLAANGPDLFALADKQQVDLQFEAAVAGAIPVVKTLRESLCGEDIREIYGIVNGTTNYMLTKMAHDRVDYERVLQEAQRLGYAEADPTADVDGLDAAAKAAILASVAFGRSLLAKQVPVEGIRNVTIDDITVAAHLGYVLKLLAVARKYDDGDVSAQVFPALVPADHPLALVNDSFNAVFVRSEAAGELMLYGRGAGGKPTASAVLGDVVEVAQNLSNGTYRYVRPAAQTKTRDADRLRSGFYLQLDANDETGALAEITAVFAQNNISISRVEQDSISSSKVPLARITFITQECSEAEFSSLLQALGAHECVSRLGNNFRVVE